MTATLVIDELAELRAENARLCAQVTRLQTFAFRDLLNATPEELQCAIDGLPADRRDSLRRLMGVSPATATIGTVGVDLTHEQRADAWRRTNGTLPPLPTIR